MSTKTTFKRVALVTVAALGFGVLATVPSQATVSANSLTLSAASSTQLTSETSTATAAVATLSFLNSGLGDTVSVTAYLMSAPAGNTATPVLQVSETSSATVGNTAGAVTAAGYENTTQVAYVSGTTSPVNVTAKWKVYMNSATKAGSYVIKLVPAVVSGGGVIDTTGVTLTITVSTNPATDTVAATATSVINSGETASATTDATVTFPKGTSAEVAVSSRAAAATIKVGLLNAAGVATTGESFTATIAGPGILGSAANSGATISGPTPIGRAVTVKAGDVVQVFNDGSSGVATVTISSALGVILATEKVTFYGAAATITASIADAKIAKATSNADFLAFTVVDAAGTAVTTGTFYVVSDATTIVSNSYTACSSYDATYGWLCAITGVKAGTANLTITSNTSATDTTGVSSAKVAVRVGTSTPSKVAVAFDKATYAPGEKATITLTLTDADGKNVPSGVYTGILKAGLVSSYALGSASDSMTDTALRYVVDGVQTYTVFMPLNSTAVTVTGTTGTTTAAANAGLATANQAAAISIAATVVNTVSDAAQAAAEEATAAANDATDAALSAAEAAEAATAMAQEAVDAVAELSAQVTSLISALRAQITALTNLVVKIQKKVKA